MLLSSKDEFTALTGTGTPQPSPRFRRYLRRGRHSQRAFRRFMFTITRVPAVTRHDKESLRSRGRALGRCAKSCSSGCSSSPLESQIPTTPGPVLEIVIQLSMALHAKTLVRSRLRQEGDPTHVPYL